jgi:agmatinase
LDIDGLDPAHAPGTGTPEGGGLTTRDLLELVRGITGNLPLRAMDVVEIAPPLDCADITSLAALKVIYEVFGMIQEKHR